MPDGTQPEILVEKSGYRPVAGGRAMKTIVKARHMELNDSLRAYVEEKIQRPAAKHFDGPSVTLEVELSNLLGPKGGKDKQCEITMSLPRGQILRIEEVEEDIYTAISVAGDRLVRSLERYKEKKLFGSRYPKKYYMAKILNREAAAESESEE
ncbi:MAG: ribosome-associated translation inhibitor RaiA [Nitrospinota bacterium]|nr:MAG: ribosome-associated translation inhibitor RaiA [Nitrospinota bacterium]